MDTIKRIMNTYNKIEKWFLIVMMSVMIVVIFAQVVTRYVFGNSLFWSEEIGKYIFVWISWLGVSAGMVNNEHIQIRIVLDALEKRGHIKAQKVMELVGNLCWIFTSGIVLYYGIELISVQRLSGVIGATTGIPMWIVYLCLPISGAIVCIRLIGLIYINICELRGKEVAND